MNHHARICYTIVTLAAASLPCVTASAQQGLGGGPPSLSVPGLVSPSATRGSMLRLAPPTLGANGVAFEKPSREVRFSDPTTRLGIPSHSDSALNLLSPTAPYGIRGAIHYQPGMRITPETSSSSLRSRSQSLRIGGAGLNYLHMD